VISPHGHALWSLVGWVWLCRTREVVQLWFSPRGCAFWLVSGFPTDSGLDWVTGWGGALRLALAPASGLRLLASAASSASRRRRNGAGSGSGSVLVPVRVYIY
jgi:hypothetical protein